MTIIITIFSLVVLLFSVMIHELAHGYVAYSLGDPTAKYEGRLTLNPLKHLDFFGSILLPLFLFLTQSPVLFGWAKPVPINPYNFRDKKFGEIKVSLAGPASNFCLAIVFGLLIRFMPVDFYNIFTRSNFNILDFIVAVNIWLGVFNLIPVPPLDGSWILFSLLPNSFHTVKNFLRRYGIAILLFLILFVGSVWLTITSTLFWIITGHMLT